MELGMEKNEKQKFKEANLFPILKQEAEVQWIEGWTVNLREHWHFTKLCTKSKTPV